jgi:glycosyltransferase involved in cell wall biosynthesis
MTTPTLSLTMIVRDVAGYIRPALESVLPYVDEIVIADTGEVSERATTRPLIEALCQEHNKPLRYMGLGPDISPDLFTKDTADTWLLGNLPLGEFTSATEDLKEFSGDTILSNFGRARQATLDAAISDYIIWIDSDDLVENASKIPALLRHMAAKALDSVLLEYDYEHNEDGHVTTRVSRARVFRRQGPCQWTFPIHEVLTPLGNSEMLRSEDDSPQVRIVHRAAKLTKDFSKSVRPPMRNYKVLLQELSRQLVANKHDKTKINPRIWFYLGNESRAFNPKLSIQFFEQYIATTTFPEEKALAHVYIGQMREGDGQLLEAQGHYATASCIFPRKPEAHFGLARIAHYLGDDQNCIHHHRQGEIAVHHKEDALHYSPFDRIVYPAICGGPAFLRLGQYKKALRLADTALALAPKSAHLLALKSRAEKEISKRWRPRKIYLWTGNALETWTPNNLDTQGIGGSETAAVHMARELAALGHDVTVFSNCGDKEGNYEGVKYVHFEHLTQDTLFNGLPIECDLFISSRRVHLFPVNAAKKILWMHDTDVGPPTQDICQKLLQFDHVLALSQWHRANLLAFYPFLDPSKVLVTSNGIDLERYRDPPAKMGNQLIYSSSPDRGLALLLELFPAIKEQVSDAELHVYYGFDNYEKIIERNAHDPQMQEYARHEIATIREAMANTRGVIYHGRVGQKELARAQLASKVAAYPTHFTETSCISMMENQAAGCIPVTTQLAALPETVHHGFLLKPPNTAEAYKAAFIKRVVWCLTHEEERAGMASRGRTEAFKLHSWKRVAEQWNDMFARMFDPSSTKPLL